ncbi:MAG: ABC transporter permease [Anaerolineales bacterium]|nr:ABC transporter permease [Anaerolineales bacterium]
MTIEYDSATTGIPAIREFQELFRYRDLLKMLVSNSIKTRYKRSALGVLWTLLNPLLNTLVLTIAFSRVFRFDVANYPVYILSGLVFWNFFAQTTAYAMQQLVWGSNLIKRIYVPRTIFAVSVVGNGLVNLSLALMPLLVIMLAYRLPLTLALLFLPVAILFMGMFVLGVSLLFSAVAVFFTDLIEIYNVGLSALYFLTPIIYPVSVLENYPWLLKINPIYILLDLFRQPIILGQVPSSAQILTGGVIAVVTMVAGWWVFTARADEFAYRI